MFSLPTDGRNRVSPGKNFTVTLFFVSGVRMPVIGCDSERKKMVAEAGYMCNVAEQHMYFTTARSKCKKEVTIPLDRVSLTACRTYGSISFTVIDHTGQ